jgi:hypothetical protein
MDTEALRLVAAVVIPLIGGVVWLVRLEGRQNTHEGKSTERWTDALKTHDHIDEKLDRLVESR